MSDQTPSLHRKKEQAWEQILLRVIQVQGTEILKRIVQNKVSGDHAPRAEFTPTQLVSRVAELGRELRHADLTQPKRWARYAADHARTLPGHANDALAAVRSGWDQIRNGPRRSEPLEKAAISTLSTAGFVGGFFFGLQLPQIDFKLSAKGKEHDSLILHAAALMASETAAEWMQEILRRTLLAPGIGETEARFLRAISRVLDASVRGIERGWSARQVAGFWMRFWTSPVVKQHRISTDAQAVRLAQELIERLRK
jgi:hypothetical protein